MTAIDPQATAKQVLNGLEYNLSHSCNLKCDHCDHLAAYIPLDHHSNQRISVSSFTRDCAVLSKHIMVQQFLLLGGEPLLNAELDAYVTALRSTGLAEKIKIVTNGHLVHRLSDDLLAKLDSITITNYASQPMLPEKISEFRRRCDHHSVDLEITGKGVFRYSILPHAHSTIVKKAVFRTCALAWSQRCTVLFDGKIGRCSRLPFISMMLKEHGVVSEQFGNNDLLPVHGGESFGEELRQYLVSPKPFDSCAYCTGAMGREVEHRQLSAEEVKNNKWLKTKNSEAMDYTRLFKRAIRLLVKKYAWRFLGRPFYGH